MAMTPTYNMNPAPVVPYGMAQTPSATPTAQVDPRMGMAGVFGAPGQGQTTTPYQAPDYSNTPGAGGATALAGTQYYAPQTDPQGQGRQSGQSAQQAAIARQQFIDQTMNIAKMPGGPQIAAQMLAKYDASVQSQSNNGDTSAQHYIRDQGDGGAYMATPGSPTGYAYGASSPQAGVDQRAWSNIYDPNAYQYGGVQGGAAAEENRYAQMGQAAGQIDLTQYNALQNGMGAQANAAGSDALGMMRATALGQTPSVANAQMQAGIASAARSQAQQAASARGGGANLVAAEQAAAMGAGNTQANAVINAGTQAAQERLNAQNAYSGAANQQQSAYAQQAGMASQLALNQGQLQQSGQLAYENMRQGVFNSQQNAQMQGEAQNANTGLSAAQMQATKDANDKAFQRQLVGGVLTAAGTVGGMAIGGPAGAVAGGAAGKAAAGAVT